MPGSLQHARRDVHVRPFTADQMRHDGGSGRRDTLAGDAVVVPAEATENFSRGRGRDGEHAVLRANATAAFRQVGDAPAAIPQRCCDASGRHHVHE